MPHRIERIAEDMKREMTDILRSIKDPRVTGLLTVVRVDVSGDLSYATVYISAMEGMAAAKSAVVGLKSAGGYIRHKIGERLSLRKSPELRFVADDSIEKGARIAEMLKNSEFGIRNSE